MSFLFNLCLNKWDEKDMNVWLLLNKFCYDFNGYGGWIMEYVYIVNCWFKIFIWWKYYLVVVYCLCMVFWNIFMVVEMLVCGCILRMNIRLVYNWLVCCYGNLVWDDIWFIWFGVFFCRDWLWLVVFDRFVCIRKFIKFIN